MRRDPSWKFWPEHDRPMSTRKLIRHYEKGFAGAVHAEDLVHFSPDLRDEPDRILEASDGAFEHVAYDSGLVGAGEDKLSNLYLPYGDLAYEIWPSYPQGTGCCVGRATTNCGMLLAGCEAFRGDADPVTGFIESLKVPLSLCKDLKQQWAAYEAIYRERGYRSHGWSCGAAARVFKDVSGLVIRQQYPWLDLSEYNERNASGSTISEMNKLGQEHRLRGYASVDDLDQAQDSIGSGFPLLICSGAGFSGSRRSATDSKGECVAPQPRRGSWSHAMTVAVCDARKITIAKFGSRVWIIQNSWSAYNSGPRRLFETDILIPKGSFAVDDRALLGILRSGGTYALNDHVGWKRANLPDGGSGFYKRYNELLAERNYGLAT